jgi:hypothetical protein
LRLSSTSADYDTYKSVSTATRRSLALTGVS